MAKANLDIAGHNGRFPELGEVIVNAGDLKPGEKARILYRHAKAVGLGDIAKAIVKKQAVMIVNHRHFTPERIRRLVDEIVPRLSLEKGISEKALKDHVSEALSNPTKQMRVSFRSLPARHRWLMFALLETDQNRFFAGVGRPELQSRYDSLCPPAVHQPYKHVLNELTEAFIKKSAGLFAEEVDWIHPSCRDLAIDELVDHSGDRQRFLKCCSPAGLALATSFAGGATGERQLPLLQTDTDWRTFTMRAEQLVKEEPSVLSVIWNNVQAANMKAAQDTSLQNAVIRLEDIIKNNLCPAATGKLAQIGYTHSSALETFFEICRGLQISPAINLAKTWEDCMADAKGWVEEPKVIWEDNDVPAGVKNYLKVLKEFVPWFLQRDSNREPLTSIHNALLERVTVEMNTYYESPKNDEDAANRAAGYDVLHRQFAQLSVVPIWTEEEGASLTKCADYFRSEADSLSEGLPSDPDIENEHDERPEADDVNINDLFRDL